MRRLAPPSLENIVPWSGRVLCESPPHSPPPARTSPAVLLRGLEVGAREEGERPTTRPYSSPYRGMFSTGATKPKKQVPTHGRSVNRMHCSTRGMLPERAALGHECFVLEVAGQKDRLPACAECRAKRIGRLRLFHAHQNRGHPDRVAVFHPALDPGSATGHGAPAPWAC